MKPETTLKLRDAEFRERVKFELSKIDRNDELIRDLIRELHDLNQELACPRDRS